MLEGFLLLVQGKLFNNRQENKARRLVYQLVQHQKFEGGILVLIIFSSAKLVVDTYIQDESQDSAIARVSNLIDTFLTTCFSIESLLKSFAYGFVLDKGSYLRENWNQLDFFIVVTSIVDAGFDKIELPVIKILRLLRTLRPLRFISHNSSMKFVVRALFESVGHIFNVGIVVLVVWLMFSILGVNLFGGKFQYCSIEKFEHGSKEECL